MNVYRFKGQFRMGRIMMPITKEVLAANEDAAREKLYCDLGSKHKTSRQHILIDEVTLLAPDEVENTVLKRHLGE